ncbi:hypothetical protein GCM10020221_12800 [Streptomyces thioluteus]|uniref:Uncharacterized protein n=1 Tax=Streptomyces thioluteus TaxID=66431 RepID=A0ABN3WJU2_STRTU
MDTAKRFDCPWLPWTGCVAFGLSSALAVAVLHRTPAAARPGRRPRRGGHGPSGRVPPERTHATAEAASGAVGPTAEAVGQWEVGHWDRARLPGPGRAADDATDQPPR